jgi:RNA polymerase sigma-70 factor, ECF subfamily
VLSETEDELIVAAQQGNIAAFERLLRPLESRMLRLAAGFANCQDDANDIYQDAMLSAFRAIERFKMDSRFSTWLHRIVVNAAFSYKRKMKRGIEQTEELNEQSDVQEHFCHKQGQPEQCLLSWEFNQQLNRALQVLTAKERMAFVLCHQQEFKIEDASTVMGCSANSIKVYLFRARNKLKQELAPMYRQRESRL